MSWKTITYNDNYSLEYNEGEGYYIFIWEDSQSVDPMATEFITKDYDEAIQKYGEKIKFVETIRGIEK